VKKGDFLNMNKDLVKRYQGAIQDLRDQQQRIRAHISGEDKDLADNQLECDKFPWNCFLFFL